jgi:hypothetical protein
MLIYKMSCRECVKNILAKTSWSKKIRLLLLREEYHGMQPNTLLFADGGP